MVAVTITVIALPSLWLMSRSGESGAPNVATAGVDIAPAGQAVVADDDATTSAPEPAMAAPPTTTVDPMGTIVAPYLAAPASTAAPGPVAIAVPDATDASFDVGDATYRSAIGDPGTCVVRSAPFGALVTVTNRNNNRSVTCRASVPPTGGDDIVLPTPAFESIADLTDAPVPVDVDW